MTTHRLKGRVVNDVQTPLAGVAVRLVSPLDPLGSDPRAAVLNPGAVTWTRRISGYQGNAWNAWQKFVARETAGITWPEFRADAAQYNPSLAESDGVFLAENAYVIPENKPLAHARNPLPDVVWDRQLSGFDGTLWDCWRQFVQQKVIGLNWEQFQADFVARNPYVSETRGKLGADRQYQLPRSADHDRYYRLEYTDGRGRFGFEGLLPGEYDAEVMADGYQAFRQRIMLDADADIVVELHPITIVVERGAEDFVDVKGTEFVLNGHPLRFIGVNLRGLVHYGDQAMLRFSEPNDRLEQLQKASDMGARVVRVFLPSDRAEVTTEVTITRLKELFQIMRDNRLDHMRLIIALTNFYDDTPFAVQGDKPRYYTLIPREPHLKNRFKLLNEEWFAGGYRDNYLPFVTRIVSEFSREPLIMAWEPGNELKVDDKPDLLTDFMLVVAQHIRDLDGNHLITTGLTSTRTAHFQNDEQRRRLYGSEFIHFITNHAYNGTNEEDDSRLVHEVNKPFIVEEAGFDMPVKAIIDGDVQPLPCVENMSRKACVAEDMQKWFERGARGYLQWAFMAGNDNNDGDEWSGMDHVLHGETDWNELLRAYVDRAAILKQETETVTIPVDSPAEPVQQLAVGMTVRTTGEVNVRRTPGHRNKLASDILGTTRPGTSVLLLSPSVPRDELTWWNVRTELSTGVTVEGWMAQAVDGKALLRA